MSEQVTPRFTGSTWSEDWYHPHYWWRKLARDIGPKRKPMSNICSLVGGERSHIRRFTTARVFLLTYRVEPCGQSGTTSCSLLIKRGSESSSLGTLRINSLATKYSAGFSILHFGHLNSHLRKIKPFFRNGIKLCSLLVKALSKASTTNLLSLVGSLLYRPVIPR